MTSSRITWVAAMAIAVGGCSAAGPGTQPPATVAPATSVPANTAAPATATTPASVTPAGPTPNPIGTPIDAKDLKGRILFGRAGGEFGDATIFTANADGTHDIRVGGFLADKTTCCPRWSADGTHIAFVVLTDDERFTTGVIEPDGSHLRRFELPGDFQGSCQIIARASDRGVCEGGHSDVPDSHGIYTANAADGSEVRTVIAGEASGLGIPLDLSPDGKQIAFLGKIVGPPTGIDEGAPYGSMYVINVDGTGLKRITPDGVYVLGARYSPDGKWIAFGGLGRSGDPLWAVRPDGSDLHELYRPADNWAAIQPTWSPDGRFVLFELDPPGTIATLTVAPKNKMCVIRADGSDLTCIIDTPDHKIWPDWVAEPS